MSDPLLGPRNCYDFIICIHIQLLMTVINATTVSETMKLLVELQHQFYSSYLFTVISIVPNIVFPAQMPLMIMLS